MTYTNDPHKWPTYMTYTNDLYKWPTQMTHTNKLILYYDINSPIGLLSYYIYIINDGVYMFVYITVFWYLENSFIILQNSICKFIKWYM